MTENNLDKTLNKNCINQFLLKIDLIKNDNCHIAKIAESMSAYFDRTEKRKIDKVTINFTEGNSELLQNEVFDFVLVSETNNVTLTFSEMQNSFWIESLKYKNNAVYKDIINKIVSVILSNCGEIESKRIGLRYINEFKCNTNKNINKIFGKRLSSIVKGMLVSNTQSRIIGMEEYNNEIYKIRLQYGVHNRFYPSVISSYDLLLDIDSFSENIYPINEWVEIISGLNHAAYACFTTELNEKYLESLR